VDKTKQIQVAMVVGGVIGIAVGFFFFGGLLTAFAGLVIGWLAGAAVGAVIVRL
jgi:hypothetical protein